jgi:hypothetical protein
MGGSRVLLVGVTALWLTLGPQESAVARHVRTEVAYLQILEGPDKVWIFIEVERVTDYSDEFFARLMSAHPRREMVSQSVFTIDSRGTTTETIIASKPPGPTFHPRLSDIFRTPDGFYLYSGPAMNHPATLFRWHENHFSPLTDQESAELRKLFPNQSFPDVLNEVDAISARSGWRRRSDRGFKLSVHADPYVSARHQIRIRVDLSDSQGQPRPAGFRPSAVVAESAVDVAAWSKTLIKVDTTDRRVGSKSTWSR